MKEEAERLLVLLQTNTLTESEIQDFTEKMRSAIKENPSEAKELALLLNKVKQTARERAITADVSWVQTDNGFLAIGHKPGGKVSFVGLKNEGATVVLTLLHENEGALQIGKQAELAGITWLWFPFSASKPHKGEAIMQVTELYIELQHLLNAENKIYIHCSAGIHRTGMITYGLLRFLGFESTKALEQLKLLRTVTAEQVGEERLLWAEQFAKI